MSWLDCSDCHMGPQNTADEDYLNEDSDDGEDEEQDQSAFEQQFE